MGDELLRYVTDQLKSGYTKAQITTALINRGYSKSLVESVVSSINLSTLESTRQPSPNLISKGASKKVLLIALAVLIIAVGAILIPKIFFKEALLDVKVTLDDQTYYPGDVLGFDVEVFNMGSKDKFDVTLTYKILDSNDNLITSKEETIAISTSASHRKTIMLPISMKKGDYTLKVFANYDDKVATAAISFNIIPRSKGQTPPPADTANTEDTSTTPEDSTNTDQTPTDSSNVENTAISCTDRIKNQDETGPDCGGICGGYFYDLSCHAAPKSNTPTPKSTGSQLLDLRILAKTNPSGAKDGCLEFADEKVRDECIKSVAQTAMTSNYCELIIDDNTRDLCYYPFFMKGDYSVCEKLVLKDSLETCAQLKQLSDLSKRTQDNPPPNNTLQQDNSNELQDAVV